MAVPPSRAVLEGNQFEKLSDEEIDKIEEAIQQRGNNKEDNKHFADFYDVPPAYLHKARHARQHTKDLVAIEHMRASFAAIRGQGTVIKVSKITSPTKGKHAPITYTFNISHSRLESSPHFYMTSKERRHASAFGVPRVYLYKTKKIT